MNGPLLERASQTRLRRLAVWSLPLWFGLLLAAGVWGGR